MWRECARCVTSLRRWQKTPETGPNVGGTNVGSTDVGSTDVGGTDMGWAEIAAARLENEHVLLRPVLPDDRTSLRAIALDPEIWRYFLVRVETDADFDAFFDLGLADADAGRRVVY